MTAVQGVGLKLSDTVTVRVWTPATEQLYFVVARVGATNVPAVAVHAYDSDCGGVADVSTSVARADTSICPPVDDWSGDAIHVWRMGQLLPTMTVPLTMRDPASGWPALPPHTRFTPTITGAPATAVNFRLVPSQTTPALVVAWRLTVSSTLATTLTSTDGVAPRSAVLIGPVARTVVPFDANTL